MNKLEIRGEELLTPPYHWTWDCTQPEPVYRLSG